MRKKNFTLRNFINKYKIFFLLCTFGLILLGCERILLGLTNNSNQDEDDWAIGHGELEQKVGSENPTLFPIEIHPDFPLFIGENVIEKSEYEAQTGKWFYYKDEGKLAYEMSAGTMKAGDKYSFNLVNELSEPLEMNKSIRVQLTERDEHLQNKKLLKEEIIFIENIKKTTEIYSNKLPDQENAVYLLSAEVLNDDESVEDTLVSLIYVPAQEINAKLFMNKKSYKTTEEKATLTLKNYGPTYLNLGIHYTIEKKVNETWRTVPLDLVFEDIGIYLQPDKTYDQMIDLSSLSKGEYRVVKDFHAEGSELSAQLATEFNIK